MKKIFFLACTSLLLLFSCKKTADNTAPNPPLPALVSTENINDFIKEKLSQAGSFEWAAAPDEMVWSALQHTDKIISIGYKPAGHLWKDEEQAGINVNESNWKAAREAVVQLVLSSEQELDKAITRDKILLLEDDQLPFINMVVENPATVKLLRGSNMIRYAEPMAYDRYRCP